MTESSHFASVVPPGRERPKAQLAPYDQLPAYPSTPGAASPSSQRGAAQPNPTVGWRTENEFEHTTGTEPSVSNNSALDWDALPTAEQILPAMVGEVDDAFTEAVESTDDCATTLLTDSETVSKQSQDIDFQTQLAQVLNSSVLCKKPRLV